MAEGIGVEPIHQLPGDGLANHCLNRSANPPYFTTLFLNLLHRLV